MCGSSLVTMTKTPGATLPTEYSTQPRRLRMPPSSLGTNTLLRSGTSTFAPCAPGTSGTRPVALAIAANSTIVLVPSWNAASILGFMFLPSASTRARIWIGVVVDGVVLALAQADHLEAQRAGEIVQLLAHARLVAGRGGVDTAGLLGHAGEHQTDRHVCLDVEHHHVFLMHDAVPGDLGSHFGHTGCFDHCVDARRLCQQQGIFGHDVAAGAAARLLPALPRW